MSSAPKVVRPMSDAAHVANQSVVYISNLPYEATSDSLEDLFEAENIEVSHVELIKKGSGSRLKSAGLACVTLKNSGDKPRCIQTMDGKKCFGRPIIVRADKFVEDDLGYAAQP